MTAQERLDALRALLDLINDEINPSNKELQSWLVMKDSLNPSPGKHHAKRNVSRGQIKGDVEALIEIVQHMI